MGSQIWSIFNKKESLDCNDSYTSIGNKQDLIIFFTYFEVETGDFDADLRNCWRRKE